MDVLSDHGACPKLSLDEAAGACGLPGKIGGHGSAVEAMVEAGRIDEVRAYCEGDTLNLFGLYLRHGLLTGRTTPAGYDASLESLLDYLDRESTAWPHLGAFLETWRGAGRLGPAPLPEAWNPPSSTIAGIADADDGLLM